MSQSMQTILIIGGTSGIGEAFARRLHQMDKQVIITGRREARLAQLAKSLPGLETYKMDNTDLNSIPGHVNTIFTTFAKIDTVWINSGIMYASSVRDISSITDARVIGEITTNVTAPILLARYILPRLMTQESPTHFLMTSSRLGFVPNGKLFPVYCPTKAAIHLYMVGIRQALRDTNVNVIEIVPPYVATNLDLEHRDKLSKGPKPMPLDEFTGAVFDVLSSTPVGELKEVGAGGGKLAVDAWRSAIGSILESTGFSD